jgi:hypothetical protein
MRKDEEGNTCPSTLFEYRDMCKAINPNCKAVKLLEQKIKENGGKDDEVVASDSQMRMLLMPHLLD